MEIIRGPVIFDVPDEEQEIWVRKKPSKGEHIKVDRGLYTHHGVYISNDEVIHFTGSEEDSVLDWSKPEVIKTDISYFLKDGELEVKEYTDDELQDLYPVEHIVAYARACLGDKGYNLVFNNCEHFANVCTLGRFRSGQVEKVFNLILWRNKFMGLFSWIGGLFKGNSSGGSRSTSNTNTTYEPDKVRIAEIESETKIRLANMEKERIDLMTNAQIDVLEKEYYCKVALEEAKARGFNNIANTIVGMQDKLNEVAEKRMQIIEKGSLQIIGQVENFYKELNDKITKDNQEYSEIKLPKLLEVLEQYDESSPAHKLYFKRIEDDMNSQLQSFNKQIEGLTDRQSKIIESFLNSKEKLIDQTALITNNLIDKMLSNDINNAELEATNDIRKLGGSSNKRLLGEGK
ncbi:MAG: lecithin retinol acyltransferase family protein [Clostridium sp.]|uniref:lecithin retinol acyltransferase family protein n=1 Tax=Clostridium sp. TaxID=1506 RepID=UPI0025BD8589|nr:lecithin retinol acyltransferase family protein [Clostridium sp.]MCE5221191.1 lecithin retinol acyltransferase family protein [Clostridium sp.]